MPPAKKMRAAVHTDAFRLDVVEKEVPRPTDYDHVLLRVAAVGICGSDKHDLDHPPMREQTPGHEFAGVIEELGSEPAGFRAGERVLARPRARCGSCGPCSQRPRGACENPGVYGCRGVHHPPGAMAEYVLVRTENLTRVPDDIPLEHAAMTDPLAVAVHAVDLGPDVKGRDCVVMGAGVIGLLLGQVLKLRGAARVAMVDVLPSHLETARSLGDFECMAADDTEGLAEKLKAFSSSIYYELAGGESPTLDLAVKCIRRGGAILLVSQRPKGVWLDYQSVMFKQLALQGVAGTSDESWAEATRLIFQRRVRLDPLITHRYPLENATEALVTAIQGDSLKVMIRPNGEIF